MDVGSLLENEMLEVLLIDDFKKSTSIEMCKSKKKNIEIQGLSLDNCLYDVGGGVAWMLKRQPTLFIY